MPSLLLIDTQWIPFEEEPSEVRGMLRKALTHYDWVRLTEYSIQEDVHKVAWVSPKHVSIIKGYSGTFRQTETEKS